MPGDFGKKSPRSCAGILLIQFPNTGKPKPNSFYWTRTNADKRGKKSSTFLRVRPRPKYLCFLGNTFANLFLIRELRESSLIFSFYSRDSRDSRINF
jgi:hypothetical protein